MQRFVMIFAAWLGAMQAVAQTPGDLKVTQETTRYVRELTLESGKVTAWTVQPSENVSIKATGESTALADLVRGSYIVTAWLTPTTGRSIRLVIGDDPTPPVPPVPGVLIEAFSLSPTTIAKGQSAKMAWQAPKAKTATLNGISVQVQGGQEVSPSATTIYNLVVTDGTKTESAQRTLNVTETPDPKPEPKPDPTPTPGPLHVLAVYETSDLTKLPQSQVNIITSKQIRDYLNSKCAKDTKGLPQFRFVDKDAKMDKEPKDWQDVFARPRKSVPWLIISNGKDAFEGEWPKDVQSFLAKLQEYGGR